MLKTQICVTRPQCVNAWWLRQPIHTVLCSYPVWTGIFGYVSLIVVLTDTDEARLRLCDSRNENVHIQGVQFKT